ncbi:MAG: Gfo/Idh/MocA family oxidoreductase [Planctomycetota bacterium]
MTHHDHGQHTGDSRRGFLRRAALAAGGVAGLAATSSGGRVIDFRARAGVAGKAAKVAREGETLGIGVIGTGGMGHAHIRSIFGLLEGGRAENVEFRALCDVNDLHAGAAKETCDAQQSFACDTYRDHRKLLERDDIHGVLIATTEHQHASIAIDALRAGKDVYLEKPMTLRLGEALELREAVKANPDKIFQVGTQKIMLEKFREAKKAIEAGRIGKPLFSQTSYCRNAPDGEWNYYEIDPEWKPGVNLDWDRWLGSLGPRAWDPKMYIRWRRYREFSTGIVGDLLVHELTPLIMAVESAGWPTRINAIGGHYIDKAMENHDQVNINVQFQNGHTMIVAGSTSNEVGLETLIRGHMGNIYLGGRHCVIRPERAFVDDIDGGTIECPDIGNDQDALRLDWFDCMRSRRAPESGVELGTKVMVIVDLATRSMWDGKTYDFDPETMRATAV